MGSHLSSSKGFTAVELLITLFIAAIFLSAGYSLYSITVTYSVESRNRAQADRIAYDYLRRYEAQVGATCAASTPVNNVSVSSNPNAQGMKSPTITVIVSCPLSSVSSVSKIVSRVQYLDGSQTKTIEQEVYAAQ